MTKTPGVSYLQADSTLQMSIVAVTFSRECSLSFYLPSVRNLSTARLVP